MRCKTPFACKPEAIHECDCRIVQLNFEETQFISKQFKDCVCNACLLELKAIYQQETVK